MYLLIGLVFAELFLLIGRSATLAGTETVAAHRKRLAEAGFAHSAVWLRYFNFVSIVAIK